MLGLNTLTLISSRIGSVLKSIIKDQLVSNISFSKKTQTASSLNYTDSIDSLNGVAETGVAYSFDGVNAYGQLSGTTQAFKTVAFTVRAPQSLTYKTIMELGDQFMLGFRDVKLTTNGGLLVLNATDTTIYIDGAVQSGTNNISTGSFHRVVIVFDNSKDSYNNRLYTFGGDGVNSFAKVDLCNIQMYSEAFTVSDVLYDHQNPNKLAIENPNTNLESNDLNFWWAMTEHIGSTAYNSSTSSGNNVTLNGGSWIRGLSGNGVIQIASMDRAFHRYNASQPLAKPIMLPALVKVSSDHSDRRDSTDALVRTVESSDGVFMGYGGSCTFSSIKYETGYNNFTLSVWAKYDYIRHNSSYNAIAILGDDAGSDFCIISRGNSTNKNGFEVRGVSGLSLSFNTNAVIGEWYNVVAVRTGPTTYKMYIDGVELGSDTSTNDYSLGSKQKLTIGRDFNIGSTIYERFYPDMVGDVLFYHKTLDADDILNNFNVTKEKYGK